jgi:hypothetical protein
MAQPVADADIDDVLASLRRLVRDGAAPPVPASDPLVLTPELLADPAPDSPPGPHPRASRPCC